jgi:hypothetical protein
MRRAGGCCRRFVDFPLMRPLDAREFCEALRTSGDFRQADLADELLAALDLQPVVDEFVELCDDLDHYAEALKGKPAKQVEWLGDRSDTLTEIADELAKHGLTGDIVEEVDKLIALIPPKLEYDL